MKKWFAISAKNIEKSDFKMSKIPPTVPKKPRILNTYLDWIFCEVEGKIQISNKFFSLTPTLVKIPVCIWPKETKVSVTDLIIWI